MIGLSSHPCFLIVSSLLVFVLHLSTAAVPISLHGLNYNTRKGPDWDPDKCKEWHEVLNDLTLQSRLTKRFRLLSMTDCGQAAMVLEVAKQLDLQLWLGLWVGQPPESSDVESAFDLDLKELKRLIDEEPDVLRSHVLGISVGSEALYREDATLDQMIQHFYTGT
jgi:exo-beta-1,3-glucanase (GH17 family)